MDKSAIVTGASRGIGREIALRLAADGFAVLVNYVSKAAEAQEVVDAIEAGGGRAIAVQGDVSNPEDAARLFDAAEAAFGGVDVLVNNAGVLQLAPLAETSDAMFERIFRINVQGTFNTLRQAATRLRNGGRIINFSSSVVGLALPTYSAYIASKGAVEGLTRVFSKELRGREISVNAVAPGPTATDLFLDGKSEAQVEAMAKMSPLERLGRPEDIAGVVAFLAGPDGGWVNGQVLRANGGVI